MAHRQIFWRIVYSLAVSFLLLTDPAFGSNEKTFRRVDDGTSHWSGFITKEAVDLFIQEHANVRLELLILTSQGGDVEAAIRLGHWMRDRKISVQVQQMCISSCANYLFVAGARKFIAASALVVWHGSARQSNFTALIDRYDSLSKKSDLNEEDRRFLADNPHRFESLRKLIVIQDEFFARLGVNEEITRLGQIRNPPVKNWTIPLSHFEKFGIFDVEGPIGYGSFEYLESNHLAIALNVKSLRFE